MRCGHSGEFCDGAILFELPEGEIALVELQREKIEENKYNDDSASRTE